MAPSSNNDPEDDDGQFSAEINAAENEALIAAFSAAGQKFGMILRKQLPEAVVSSETDMMRARSILRRAAGDTTAILDAASKRWLRNPATLAAAVRSGQKSAAASVGIQFGGVNQMLVDRLKASVAADLVGASHSVTPLLDLTLRKANAIAVETANKALSRKVSADFNANVSRSLVASAEVQDLYAKTTKRLMTDLDLQDNDRVLFLGGYRMDAKDYSKLLVRTRTMEALNQGKASELMNGGYQFIRTTEHDGVDPRDICFFLQGRVWALSANEQGIPVLPAAYGLPPWHPNCVHTFSVWIPQFNGGDSGIEGVLRNHADDAETLQAWAGKTHRRKL